MPVNLLDRRISDRFADALDSAGPVEPELRTLARTAEALRALPVDGDPAPDFRLALRQRLVHAAAEQAAVGIPARPGPVLQASNWLRSWRSRRVLALGTGTLAGAVALSGVAVGAERSLPGQALYGLKRDFEAAHLFFVHGDYSRGQLYLAFARERLSEVQALLRGGASDADVTQALRDMNNEAMLGSRDLTDAFATSHSAAPLHLLASFATEQQQALTAVFAQLPAAAVPTAQQSLSLLSALDQRANALLVSGACGHICSIDGKTVTVPSDRLGVLPCGCAATAPAQPAASGSPRPAQPRRSSSPASPSGAPSGGGAQPGGGALAPGSTSGTSSPLPVLAPGDIQDLLNNMPSSQPSAPAPTAPTTVPTLSTSAPTTSTTAPISVPTVLPSPTLSTGTLLPSLTPLPLVG